MPGAAAACNEENMSEQSLQIKQDDRFFSRIMSKESSRANSSSRVYYGRASGAIPFMWESQPGTPKHALFSDTTLPPLTPPPSYYSTYNSKSKHKNNPKPTLFATIFSRLMTFMKNRASAPSFSWSSTSSSSSSSSSWSSSLSTPTSASKNSINRKSHGCRYLSCPRSPVHHGIDDNDNEHDPGLPTSTSCFGTTCKALEGLQGCYSVW